MEFLPDTHHILVTNDGTELTKSLLVQLKEKGHKVVVLNLPNINNPVSDRAVNLSANSDKAVQKAIKTIQAKYGKTGSFIHLHPHFEFQNGNFTQHFKAEKEISLMPTCHIKGLSLINRLFLNSA